jgi:hypothetical protein
MGNAPMTIKLILSHLFVIENIDLFIA